MLSSTLTSIVLVAIVQLVAVARGTPAGLLTSREDTGTVATPLLGNSLLGDETKVIRGLLVKRQSSCPIGTGLCTDGGCCPTGGACCSGGGCCDIGEYCTVISGQPGCCKIGKVCTSISGGGGCATSTYVPCAGESFCCPPGDTCSRDGAGNPQCNPANSNPFPTTTTNTVPLPGTPTPIPTTSSPKPVTTPKTVNAGGNTNTPDQITNGLNSIGTGTTSSRSSSTSTGLPSAQLNGASNWRSTSSYLGLVPFLVFAACVL